MVKKTKMQKTKACKITQHAKGLISISVYHMLMF